MTLCIRKAKRAIEAMLLYHSRSNCRVFPSFPDLRLEVGVANRQVSYTLLPFVLFHNRLTSDNYARASYSRRWSIKRNLKLLML